MFDPNVTIVTGHHRNDIEGIYVSRYRARETTGKCQAVIVEGNIWIGANATILKGVTVGEGSIIAVGEVIANEVSPIALLEGYPQK